MNQIELSENAFFQFVITGKFEAPNENWKHAKFPLTEYELFIITEGILYLSYANENYTVKEGEYLLLPPGTAFREGFKESYTSFYWLHFTDTTDNLKTLSFPIKGSIPRPEKLIVLMKQLQDMKKSNYPLCVLNSMTTTIIYELYGQLYLRKLSEGRQSEADSAGVRKQIYLDIMDFVSSNIDKNIKVSDIASAFGYNEKYLSHRFSEVAGISLKQYVIREKINKANLYLTDTNNSVSDIATSLGFIDSHNFCRTYKKCTGLTPSEYRNAYAKRLLFHY